ncbi:hypothetical protein Dsin_029269 [Dipteronia sinensis]|uniref:Endonuclease/exonuclease/phosphatase n=1 Tax=Dipteronia sinensis TaxID=43782 RepID=A0AAD9ZSA1_9ROSI|nr:hypothetical protein Dsin_029269 [Dipteronia sinensis]
MEVLRTKLAFIGTLVVNAVGRSGGLCLFWTDRVRIDLLSFSQFHIDVQVKSHVSKIWRLTRFYGNLEAEQRCHGWTLLRRLRGMSQLPLLCFGDFNEILRDCEKVGDVLMNMHMMDDFRETLDWCELSDMGFKGPFFTCSNKWDGRLGARASRSLCVLLQLATNFPEFSCPIS